MQSKVIPPHPGGHGGSPCPPGRRTNPIPRWAASLRKLYASAFEILTRKEVLLWPPFRDRDTLADIYNRLSFYFDGDWRVSIPVMHSELRPSAEVPSFMPRYESRFEARFFVPRRHGRRLLLAALRYRRILLWRRPQGRRATAWVRLLPNLRVVDPTECEYEGAVMGAGSVDHRRRAAAGSQDRFLQWRAARPTKDKVYLLCTGPTLARFREFDFSDGYVIACNSIASDEAVLRHARPELLVAADPVFHFGPSSYAWRFREALARAARWLPFLFATVDDHDHLVRRHVSLPVERVLEVPIGRDARLRRLDESWSVPRTANVLTLLMLPLAWSLAESIFVLGADGRAAGEAGFWTRLEPPELARLERSVAECHPAFFNRRDYPGYYEEHCAMLEHQIRTIEAAGGRVRTLTPSLIPALASRLADGCRF